MQGRSDTFGTDLVNNGTNDQNVYGGMYARGQPFDEQSFEEIIGTFKKIFENRTTINTYFVPTSVTET